MTIVTKCDEHLYRTTVITVVVAINAEQELDTGRVHPRLGSGRIASEF